MRCSGAVCETHPSSSSSSIYPPTTPRMEYVGGFVTSNGKLKFVVMDIFVPPLMGIGRDDIIGMTLCQ